MGAGIWGAFLTTFGTLALDATAALLSGSSSHVEGLKDKSARSDAYGTPWSRGRGVIRLQGKVLWSTHIQTSLWKTTSGGLFGLGQKSITYEKYSVSQFIGFGKKLGGGAAADILRIWADGKLLFNKVTSTGAITGAVTVTTVGGGQPSGQQFILLDVASGAVLKANAGDLVILGADPQPYTVQVGVNVSGPASSVSVAVWPPLRQAFAGGGAATLSQQSISPYDLSSFDPNPHDGSHTSGGYPCPPGGVTFYYGSDTQTADPTMVKHLGAANVPGYRGLAAVCLHDLQLANYGNHCPQITAEIAFDIASPNYPLIGPIAGVDLVAASLGAEYEALPFSGNEAIQWTNPFTQRLPYIWTLSAVGSDATHDATIYRTNTQTHQLEASVLVDRVGTFRFTGAGMVADNDGFLYFVQNNATITKMDGQTLSIVLQIFPFVQGHAYNVLTLYCYDTLQSLFGNNIVLKLGYFGGFIFDRTVMLPLGTPNGLSTQNVVTGYTANPDGTGKPIVTAGDPVNGGVPFHDGGTFKVTDDSQGNIWVLRTPDLIKIDGQFISSIVLDSNNQPIPVLALPSFATTTTDVSSITNGGVNGTVQFYPGDNTIVVFGLNKMGKVDCSTNAITQVVSAPINEGKAGETYDPMGGMIVSGAPGFVRVDLGSLQIIGSGYDLSNWVTAAGGQAAGYVYDPYTDSIWLNGLNNGITFGGLNQALLDRGSGGGFGLDAVVTSLMLDAGYLSSEFDVTSLTASGLTLGGWEFERKTFKESLQELMRHFLFDAAEIDGKIHFVVRGQASVVTIPEDDLGALDDPSKYEMRVSEVLQDERDTPRKVTVKYYDYLKDDQQATQEAERIAQPYASSLTGAKPNTNSKQQLDIVSPLFDYSLKPKQQADKILWDQWAGRFTRTFKLGPKYIRLDPTDVVTLDYKGLLLETRLTECDFGSGFARQLIGSSQDASVYTSSITTSSSGSGGGVIGTPPVVTSLTYTISPASPLSEASATEIDMVQVTATWSDGRRTVYAARAGGSGFTVSDPGGTPTLYYVTIYDPNRLGELPGVPSLTAYCTQTPTAANVGTDFYVFMGTITITHDGTGVVVTSGGSSQTGQAIGFYVNGSGGTPPPSTATIDLLSYTVHSARASFHLQGFAANTQASKNYSYLDPTIKTFAFVKAAAGWAADILVYDGTYIYQSVTELDDVGYRLWSVNTAYKRLVVSHGYPTANALPIMPRFLTPGQTVRIDVPAPNHYNRYVSCSFLDQLDKGAVTNITYGPVMMNFDSQGAGGGNLGTVSVIVNERYAGSSARERFYFGLNLSLIKWDIGTLVSGAKITGVYKITNWSVHNKLTAGGGVSLSVGCGVVWP